MSKCYFLFELFCAEFFELEQLFVLEQFFDELALAELEQFFELEQSLLEFEQLFVDWLSLDLLEFEQLFTLFSSALLFSFFRPNIFPPYRKYLSTQLLFVEIKILYNQISFIVFILY